MNNRVKGSSSEVGDGRWNRITVPSAKCKGNKARQILYQGQALVLLAASIFSACSKASRKRRATAPRVSCHLLEIKTGNYSY
jgi:hypothetical protein